MNQITTTKIKNGTLTLPQSLAEAWQNKEVIILPSKDRIVVQPLEEEWDTYEDKLKKAKGRVRAETINEAFAWA